MMWLLLLLVVGAAAQDSEEGRVKFCGRELARAHSLFCYGLETKHPGFESNDVDRSKIPERFSYKSRRAADTTDLESILVETCCRKPCHISDLLKHC